MITEVSVDWWRSLEVNGGVVSQEKKGCHCVLV